MFAGTTVTTGEEVAIKLVRALPLKQPQNRPASTGGLLATLLRHHSRSKTLLFQRTCSLLPLPAAHFPLVNPIPTPTQTDRATSQRDSRGFVWQESVKSRHPQLLYESKIYRILSGGGKWHPFTRPGSSGPPRLTLSVHRGSGDPESAMVWCGRGLQCDGNRAARAEVQRYPGGAATTAHHSSSLAVWKIYLCSVLENSV